MIGYDYSDLFEEHESVSLIIVNSSATVTGVEDDAPEIENADFVLTEDNLDQESLDLRECLNSDTNLKFGSMEASCMQFDIFNDPSIPTLKDIEVSIYLYFEGDSSTLFQVGVYLVQADEYSDDRSTRHVTMYDLNFFLRDYDITKWYNNVFKTTPYRTIKYLRDDLFDWLVDEEPDLTIVQQETTFVNDDLELEKGIESDVVTFGFFMSGILEANGVFGHIGRDGTFEYVDLESYDKPAKLTITEDRSLAPTQYENYHVWGIGYVAIYDRNNICIAKEGSSAYKHPSIYNIVNSFVFSNSSNRAGWEETVKQAAQKLRDKITHMWYYPIENECEGNLCYEVGDRIDLVLEDYDEETEGVDDEVPIITNLYSYILEREFTGIQEFTDLLIAKGDRKQPKYKINNDRWHPGDSNRSTSGSGSGGVSYVDSEHDRRLMQLLRNRGDRFLDEPSNVNVVYDRQNVEVAIKWTDPPDINTQQPHECEWAGTCVIRKEDSAPLNRWDGTLIVKSTTRDQYEVSAYVDDTIELNKKYYYAIMPYYIGLDDSSNSIGIYTWTKVVSVNTAVSMMSPLITGLQVYDVNVIATFEIPTLESGSYSYIKIVAKKGSIPTSKTDGIVKDLQASDTGVQFTGLDPESRYYFVIFASDGVTEVASDPEDCLTGLASYAFFEKLYTLAPIVLYDHGVYHEEYFNPSSLEIAEAYIRNTPKVPTVTFGDSDITVWNDCVTNSSRNYWIRIGSFPSGYGRLYIEYELIAKTSGGYGACGVSVNRNAEIQYYFKGGIYNYRQLDISSWNQAMIGNSQSSTAYNINDSETSARRMVMSSPTNRLEVYHCLSNGAQETFKIKKLVLMP